MRFITLVALMLVVLLMSTNAISGEYPFLMDLGQLKLAVANVEAIDQISALHGPMGNIVISVKKGYKLVVVTLKGVVTHPCRIFIDPTEFIALYKEETADPKGEEEHIRIENSDAAAIDDTWVAPVSTAEGIEARITLTMIRQPGPTIIKVAFVLPEKVTDFLVYYPALAKGKATISAEIGDRS